MQVVLNKIERMLFGNFHIARDFFVFDQGIEFVSGLGVFDIDSQVTLHINGVCE